MTVEVAPGQRDPGRSASLKSATTIAAQANDPTSRDEAINPTVPAAYAETWYGANCVPKSRTSGGGGLSASPGTAGATGCTASGFMARLGQRNQRKASKANATRPVSAKSTGRARGRPEGG